jgi:act minimal PKS acyl carrier protein
MSQFTLDDLRRILREGAGDSGALDGDIADAIFSDLGYDSLALLELSSRVEREYHVSIPDDAALAMRTPAAAVAYVNDRLATSA